MMVTKSIVLGGMIIFLIVLAIAYIWDRNNKHNK